MKLELTITQQPGDEPIKVRTNLLCVAEWEREQNRKVSDGRGIGVMDLAYWAHFLLKLGGKTTTATYKEWLAQYPDLDIDVVDLTDPNPTGAATIEGN
jgi:hypothetical protein